MNDEIQEMLLADSPDNPENSNTPAESVFESIALLEEFDLKITQIEEQLSGLKAKRRTLEEGVIPELMISAGVKSVALSDGRKVEIQSSIQVSLPRGAEDREAAFEYISGRGAGSLIKSELHAKFEKSQHNQALYEAERLKEDGFTVKIQNTIHPATLKKWAREEIQAGRPLEEGILPVYEYRKAVIKGKRKPEAAPGFTPPSGPMGDEI